MIRLNEVNDMKELYTSPEVKLVAFAASEELAGLDLNFNDFFNGGLSLAAPGDPDSSIDAKLPL